MPAPVVDGDDAGNGDIESSLFLDFLDGIIGDRLIDITPPAGQRPFSRAFANEQDLVLLENGCARIDLGCLIASLIAEEIFDFCERQLCLRCHHCGGNIAQFLIALKVKPVPPIMKAGLCKALDLHGPVKPLLL